MSLVDFIATNPEEVRQQIFLNNIRKVVKQYFKEFEGISEGDKVILLSELGVSEKDVREFRDTWKKIQYSFLRIGPEATVQKFPEKFRKMVRAILKYNETFQKALKLFSSQHVSVLSKLKINFEPVLFDVDEQQIVVLPNNRYPFVATSFQQLNPILEKMEMKDITRELNSTTLDHTTEIALNYILKRVQGKVFFVDHRHVKIVIKTLTLPLMIVDFLSWIELQV